MDIDAQKFAEQKEKAHAVYTKQRAIYNPYFRTQIILNSDGFHHLQFSSRKERNKREQLLKLTLLPLAFEIIKNAGTIQEYRTLLTPIGKASGKSKAISMKQVEYWGLIGIVGTKRIKVRAILRRIGDGNITFWSVMPYSKIKNGQQKLFSEGIEDE
ncbi:MAG TPA: hypothetical protein VHB48_17165 [Chitinophagaceae bacterium]|nr:hypothetical protein [Chitinophagaceae bacterium]